MPINSSCTHAVVTTPVGWKGLHGSVLRLWSGGSRLFHHAAQFSQLLQRVDPGVVAVAEMDRVGIIAESPPYGRSAVARLLPPREWAAPGTARVAACVFRHKSHRDSRRAIHEINTRAPGHRSTRYAADPARSAATGLGEHPFICFLANPRIAGPCPRTAAATWPRPNGPLPSNRVANAAPGQCGRATADDLRPPPLIHPSPHVCAR